MPTAQTIVGIFVIILGIALLIFGIYKVYTEETSSTATPKSSNLGWGLIVASIFLLAAGAIIIIARSKSQVTIETAKSK